MGQFKFRIDFGNGFEDTNPLYKDLLFEFEKKRKQSFYRKKLVTNLTFIGEDFEKFYVIEQSSTRCEKMFCKIYIDCDNQENLLFDGYFSLAKGKWDLSKCKLKIPLKTIDDYDCLMENWKTEQNILLNTTKYLIKGTLGTLDYSSTCSGPVSGFSIYQSPLPNSSNCVNLNEGWTVYTNDIDNLSSTGNGLHNGTAHTKWVREKITSTTQPPGTGWISIGNNEWVRPIEYIPDLDIQTIQYNNNQPISVHEKNFLFSDFEFDNAVKLDTVLDLLNDCNYNIKSNFFHINADGVFPNNIAYIACQAFTNIAIFQKSDILLHDAGQNATKAKLTLKKLLKYLQNIFNVRWRIDGNSLIIEHYSYFSNNQGEDLTNLESGKYLVGKNKYEYETAEFPEREVFKWMDGVSGLFEGLPIEYKNACIEIGREENYNIDEVTTDVRAMLQFTDSFSDDGFVFVAILEHNGINAMFDSNKHLSFTHLHQNYWMHGRPQQNGVLNNTETEFLSTIRTKAQDEIEFPFCCDKLINFNPESLMNTQLGWGQVKKAKWSSKKKTMIVNLIHDV